MRHGLILATLLVAGCNPYQNLDGDYYLGAVDATNFQSDYLGSGKPPFGSGFSSQSVGLFAPSYATNVDGNPVAYYPFHAGAGALTIDLAAGGNTALVYVFDGDTSKDTTKCTPPSKTYHFDPQRDYVPFNQQGNVFEDQTAAPPLPTDDVKGTDSTSYVPILEEVSVTSDGENCQSVHSAEGLVKNHSLTVAVGPKPLDTTEHQVGTPNGKYVAMAMVDPRAQVLRPDGTLDDATGLGATRWGYYNHYLAGYIEGGEVPVGAATMPDPNGGPDIPIIQAKAATILAPNTTVDMMGNPVPCDTANPLDPAGPCLGSGADLIYGINGDSAARGDSGYSPICKILTYTPADPTMPATDPTMVDPQSIDPDSGTFVYCLQVAQ